MFKKILNYCKILYLIIKYFLKREDRLHFSPADHLAIFSAEVAEGKTWFFSLE